MLNVAPSKVYYEALDISGSAGRPKLKSGGFVDSRSAWFLPFFLVICFRFCGLTMIGDLGISMHTAIQLIIFPRLLRQFLVRTSLKQIGSSFSFSLL